MASIHVEEPIPDEEQIEESTDGVDESNDATMPEAQDSNDNKVVQYIADPRKRLVIFAVVFLLIFIGYALKSNYDKQQLEDKVSTLSSAQSAQGANEASKFKDEISQFLELPDETPTVATVVDAEKVREQSFFRNSNNGDKVLIFATSGKAILYRPSTKKIIEVAPINLGQNDAPKTDGTNEESVPTQTPNQ